MSQSNLVRLQKYIADCGITSRRKAEELILQGRVKVNGMVETTLGTKVSPGADAVEVDGQCLDLSSVQKTYIVMNKPRGYVTTLSDPEGRRTVMDLCAEVSERIYPVGRLDYLSEGLLILTNDGDLANRIMHPSFNVIKVYEVKVFGSITEPLLKKLRSGVKTEDGFLKPKSVRVIKQLPAKTWLEFRLEEGRNREIRKICEACGITIDKLKRVAIGGLTVDNLAPGRAMKMTKRKLLSAIGMDSTGKIIDKEKTFFSNKKSVNLKKKSSRSGPVTPADADVFSLYRKDKYYDSIKMLKEKKIEAIKAEEAKRLAEYEEKFKPTTQK